MKQTTILVSSLVLLTFWLSNCNQQPAPDLSNAAAQSGIDLVKRGEYLVGTVGCDDCHTPKTMTPQGPAPDMTRRLMGHPVDEPFEADEAKKKMIAETHVAIFSPGLTAAAGPWGVTYASNLTPDDTGIGVWSEEQFIKALREGKSKGMDGTRPLLPPMPWQNFAKMTDDDLKAIFAYLKSIKPIPNAVPGPKML